MTDQRFRELYDAARTAYHAYQGPPGDIVDVQAVSKARRQYHQVYDLFLIECDERQAGLILEAERRGWPKLETLAPPPAQTP